MCTPQIYNTMRGMMGSPSLQSVAPGIPMPGAGVDPTGGMAGMAGHGMPAGGAATPAMTPRLPTAAASEAAARAQGRRAPPPPALPPPTINPALAQAGAGRRPLAVPPEWVFQGQSPTYQEPPSRAYPRQEAEEQLRQRGRPTMGDM